MVLPKTSCQTSLVKDGGGSEEIPSKERRVEAEAERSKEAVSNNQLFRLNIMREYNPFNNLRKQMYQLRWPSTTSTRI